MLGAIGRVASTICAPFLRSPEDLCLVAIRRKLATTFPATVAPGFSSRRVFYPQYHSCVSNDRETGSGRGCTLSSRIVVVLGSADAEDLHCRYHVHDVPDVEYASSHFSHVLWTIAIDRTVLETYYADCYLILDSRSELGSCLA